MIYFIIALVVYLLSALLLGGAYTDKSIMPSFWTIFVLVLPIVNTIVLIYLVTGYSSGFKDFIKELKEARKEK